MDQRTIQILWALLRSAISETDIIAEEIKDYASEKISELMRLSSKHDVEHLVAWGAKQNLLISKDNHNLEISIFKAIYRYERLKYDYDKLCKTFEQLKIPFIPLKGSVIRKYYPKEWMRTSCDIDILIHETDLEYAKCLLINENGYTYHGKGSHDISFITPNQMHIELHYALVEDGIANEASEILKKVWDSSTVIDGCDFCYEMSDEMFYYYHIAHMAKHFEHGGCGIRPFIDLWILDNLPESDEEKRNALLQRGNLLKFANSARKLSRVWFANEEHDLISKQMEDYILHGGVYGNIENRVIVQQQKKGGRIRYVMSKIFIPYDEIKFHYPILQKHRWLTPFMEVRRWCKLIFCGHLKRAAKELRYNNNVSSSDAENIKLFLENIGL